MKRIEAYGKALVTQMTNDNYNLDRIRKIQFNTDLFKNRSHSNMCILYSYPCIIYSGEPEDKNNYIIYKLIKDTIEDKDFNWHEDSSYEEIYNLLCKEEMETLESYYLNMSVPNEKELIKTFWKDLKHNIKSAPDDERFISYIKEYYYQCLDKIGFNPKRGKWK